MEKDENMTANDTHTDSNTPETINILGAGLAGMVCALKLVQRGLNVDLYESKIRLGGKAGSDIAPKTYDKNLTPTSASQVPDGIMSDHGYHIFPAWYVNMKALWREIGINEKTDCYLGVAPKNLAAHHNPYVFTEDEKPTIQGKITVIDLVSHKPEEVENQTLKGFILSRPYNAPGEVSFSRLLLNALTIQEYDVSARTLRSVFSIWTPVATEPNWLALKGSLGRVLIDQLEVAIVTAAKKNGATFNLISNAEVKTLGVNNDALTATLDVTGTTKTLSNKPIVLALPQEVLREMNTDTIASIEPALGQMQFLSSNTFGALDIYFDIKIDAIPKEHFRLLDSEYALTAFDISQHWPEVKEHYPGRTVMQFVGGNCASLNKLTAEGFLKTMLIEIEKYIPEVATNIDFIVPHQNIDAPLFVNEVGVWPHRPTTKSQFSNAYFAGDYVQHSADVASMEGAVRSGLNAAEAVRQDYAMSQPAIELAKDPTFSGILLYAKMFFEHAGGLARALAWAYFRVLAPGWKILREAWKRIKDTRSAN